MMTMPKWLVCSLALVTAHAAVAQALPQIPVQGFLTDSAGNPRTGVFPLVFNIYQDAVTPDPILTLRQPGILVDHGFFTAYLEVAPAILATRPQFVGFGVEGEAEVDPRLRLGEAPYAVFARSLEPGPGGSDGLVPSGAVMFFELSMCPAGWTAFGGAQGRTVVGAPLNGMVGGTVGTALTNLENRTHLHVVDAPAATTAPGGDHAHSIDPSPVTTSSVTVPHTHTVDPPLASTTSSSHSHVWVSYTESTHQWLSGDGVNVVKWADGMDQAGTGLYPIAATSSYGNQAFNTSANAHSHNLDLAPITSSAATATAHAHSVDLPAMNTSQAGGHAHPVDLAPINSSTANTGQVIPYVQLLACRKN